MPIVVKIDVTKIDKTKLFKGEKGTYLDIVLLDSPQNQYGNDYMVVQSVSKEEREAGVKGAILGNGKIVGAGARPKPQEGRTVTVPGTAKPAVAPEEDVPW